MTIFRATPDVERGAFRRCRGGLLVLSAMVATGLAAPVGPADATSAPQAGRSELAKPRPLALQAGRSKGLVKSRIGKGGVAVTCSKRGVRLTFVVFSTTPKIKVHGNGPLLAIAPAGRNIEVTCS